jgi:hypothetical protein
VAIVLRVESALRERSPRGPLDSPSSACARLWRRRRTSAVVSVVLWFVLVLAGTALASH